MKTLQEIVKLSCDYIRQKSSSHTRREVEELIAFSLGKKRLDLYLNFDKPLSEQELALIRKNLTRLAQNEPLQYIEGSVDFYGCKIAVDKRVLIPRPETELLVERIVKEIKPNTVLWDICTGSGCIGIAVKKAHPSVSVVLSDLSQDALDVAKKNAELNNVDVECIQGDLLEPFKGKKADYIVSNPPYIAESEYVALDAHVKHFEPKLALVSGQSGLECYVRMIAGLKAVCNPGAVIWFEIGHTQADAIIALLEAFSDPKIIQDFSGKSRFIQFKL